MTITTGRAHARRIENARYATRTYGGQFAPAVRLTDEKPDATSWQARFGQAITARPLELRQQWLTFAELLWPTTRLSNISYQESALKTEKAIELWLAGERDLPTLAAQVNAAYLAQE